MTELSNRVATSDAAAEFPRYAPSMGATAKRRLLVSASVLALAVAFMRCRLHSRPGRLRQRRGRHGTTGDCRNGAGATAPGTDIALAAAVATPAATAPAIPPAAARRGQREQQLSNTAIRCLRQRPAATDSLTSPWRSAQAPMGGQRQHRLRRQRQCSGDTQQHRHRPDMPDGDGSNNIAMAHDSADFGAGHGDNSSNIANGFQPTPAATNSSNIATGNSANASGDDSRNIATGDGANASGASAEGGSGSDNIATGISANASGITPTTRERRSVPTPAATTATTSRQPAPTPAATIANTAIGNSPMPVAAAATPRWRRRRGQRQRLEQYRFGTNSRTQRR